VATRLRGREEGVGGGWGESDTMLTDENPNPLRGLGDGYIA
jgi:hypothetical protein